MAGKLCKSFAIDPRSLAMFRIAAGTLLLADVWVRAGDFAAHYTEGGVLPLEALREWLGSASWRWSLYRLEAADWWPAVLLGLTGVCGLLLVLGLATRTATLAAWILAVSLHNRMPVVINAGDTLLHVLLFWGIFLPLGAKWSVDALLRRRRLGLPADEQTPTAICSAASAAILVQMALLYVCSGIYKLGNEDWRSGLSLYYIMSFDAYARSAAAWMLQHTAVLKLLTWGTLLLEIGGPIVAFSPWRTGLIRLAVIASFAAFHLGIEATMTVGQFSWVSMAGWLLFVPAGFWDAIGKLLVKVGVGERGHDGVLNVDASAATTAPVLNSSNPASRGRAWLRRCAACLILVLLGLTLVWNFTGFAAKANEWRPAWFRPVMEAVGLRQEWRMFTRPPKRDGWPRVAANLTDGSQWDLLEGEPGFNWKRRELPSAMAPNHRWRKYYYNLVNDRNARLRPYFCRYLARQLESERTERIRTVDFYQVQETTGPPGEEPNIARKLLHRETIHTEGAFFDAAESDGPESFEIHPGI